MNWETIIFFGDSLTKGARTYLGYPEYSGDYLQKSLNNNWNVINHSENGITAIDLARSIGAEFSNLNSANSLLSVILIGTNDAKYCTDPIDYKIALEQVIIKAKLLTENENVLLLSLPEFPKGISLPYTSEMNVSIKNYNSIIKELSIKHEINNLTVEFNGEHFADGVHFNKKGTVFFANTIVDFILMKRGM